MTFLDRLRDRSSLEEAGDPGPPEASSPEAGQLPIPGYDQLDAKLVVARLSQLSQVELGAVEAYERSHKDRKALLDKLRYMRTSEPLAGYDALDSEGILKALAGADTNTVKAVRDYERKFKHRHAVLSEAGRVLPTSQLSAEEDRARKEQKELIREGVAGRDKTAGGLASGQ
jgi:hypothetical protein